MAGTNGYNPGAAVSLRDLRQQRGLSLRGLEEATGVSRAIWSQVERGKLLAEPRQLAALSRALDIPPDAWRDPVPARGAGAGVTAVIEMSEAELQQAVIDTARTFGFRVAHFRAAQTKHGWRTPVQADGKGFPDLVLVNRAQGRLLFAELKSGKGKLTPEQAEWIKDITAVRDAIGETTYPGHGPLGPLEVHLWTPEDWPDRIVEILSGRSISVTRGALWAG